MTRSREFVNLTSWQSERGFSQAVAVPVRGRWIALAGAGSEASSGEPEAPGDVVAQCRAAWASITEVLAALGGDLTDLVRVRTYVTDPRHLPDVTKVRKEVLARPYPPHTFLVVSALARPHMLVEIEVDALVDTDDGGEHNG